MAVPETRPDDQGARGRDRGMRLAAIATPV
jgi:hypothetical protein